MITFDFTAQGRKPSTQQIIKRWKDEGRPRSFAVEYGETFAEFTRLDNAHSHAVFWDDSGNGCSGVNRGAVVKALQAAGEARRAEFDF